MNPIVLGSGAEFIDYSKTESSPIASMKRKHAGSQREPGAVRKKQKYFHICL